MEEEQLVAENRALREQLGGLEERLAQREAFMLRTRIIVITAIPVVLLLALGFDHRWTSDDSFIDFRVVRQVLAGHGPVFNVGQRVEAYTSPLWLAMLILCGLIASVEVGSVVMGLLLSVGGLALAEMGALYLIRHARDDTNDLRPGSVLPLGAVIFVAVPAVWDFATSGLETGLCIGWIGLSFWLLVRQCVGRSTGTPSGHRWDAIGMSRAICALVFGLGPLIRPDLAIISVGFLGALIYEAVVRSARSRRIVAVVQILVVAAIVPVAYEVFRAGYFAVLLPNTALTKEGLTPSWANGGAYFGDFVDSYALWVPLIGVLWWWFATYFRLWTTRDWVTAAVWLAPLLSAVIHAIYVVRVGGDFMHGRFFIPTLFAFLLPLMLVRVPFAGTSRVVYGGVAGVLLGWAAICGLILRVPYAGQGIGPDGIADERSFYVNSAHTPNPVTIESHDADSISGMGKQLVAESRQFHRTFIAPNDAPVPLKLQQLPIPARIDDAVNLIDSRDLVGQSSFLAGTDVFLVDRFGLADPIDSRIELGQHRGRPGHEKYMPYAWVVAEFTDPSQLDNEEVTAARAALRCGDLLELLSAVDEPMTVGRFVRNIGDSPRLTRLRIPGNPFDARNNLCGAP